MTGSRFGTLLRVFEIRVSGFGFRVSDSGPSSPDPAPEPYSVFSDFGFGGFDLGLAIGFEGKDCVFGFLVPGFGFRVWVSSLGFQFSVFDFRFSGFRFRSSITGSSTGTLLRVFEIRDPAFRFRVSGFGSRVSGSGFGF